MHSVFIGGIPASGKTYLAKKLSEATSLPFLETDDLKKEMEKDPDLKPWVNYYWNLDEKKYYTETSCQGQWKHLVNQSEAFWPYVLAQIQERLKNGPLIIEGVNILPHLAREGLNFSGVYLLGESKEKIYERIKKEPRWGKTEELKQLETESFFNCERVYYKQEAEKYSYRTFTSAIKAENALMKMIKRE